MEFVPLDECNDAPYFSSAGCRGKSSARGVFGDVLDHRSGIGADATDDTTGLAAGLGDEGK